MNKLGSLCFAMLTIVICAPAFAGKNFEKVAPTESEACWLADRAANSYAKGKSDCYSACKKSLCKKTSDGFRCNATGHDHDGSCDGSTTNAYRDKEWLRNHPNPNAASPITEPVQSVPTTSVMASITIEYYQPGAYPTTAYVKNNTDKPKNVRYRRTVNSPEGYSSEQVIPVAARSRESIGLTCVHQQYSTQCQYSVTFTIVSFE